MSVTGAGQPAVLSGCTKLLRPARRTNRPSSFAQPQIASAILHHADVARRRVATGHVLANAVPVQVAVSRRLIRGDRAAAGMIIGERVDFAVAGAAGATG